MSKDGSMMIHIDSDRPSEGNEAIISVEFIDVGENPIEHVNFEITASQDGVTVLSEMSQHSHSGFTEFKTDTLVSDSPITVQVTILGLGLPDDKAKWTGPMGETVSTQVVPEFGSITIIILAVAIVSIVSLTTRSIVIMRS